jgi:hypothetical protein
MVERWRDRHFYPQTILEIAVPEQGFPSEPSPKLSRFRVLGLPPPDADRLSVSIAQTAAAAPGSYFALIST